MTRLPIDSDNGISGSTIGSDIEKISENPAALSSFSSGNFSDVGGGGPEGLAGGGAGLEGGGAGRDGGGAGRAGGGPAGLSGFSTGGAGLAGGGAGLGGGGPGLGGGGLAGGTSSSFPIDGIIISKIIKCNISEFIYIYPHERVEEHFICSWM